MTAAVPETRTVEEKKVKEYLLNETHEAGGPKARFFLARGFSPDRWQEIAAALVAHPERNPVEGTSRNEYGTKYVVRCRIETPDGRAPCIVTVWMDRDDKGDARLVTAYPAD